MISWIGWLDSYENLSLFFVIMFLPASKKHSNHIQDPRNSAAFATMGSSASSRKLLQPHVFAALKAMGTEVKLWGIWVLYGPLKRPGRFINMEPENTHTNKKKQFTIFRFCLSLISLGVFIMMIIYGMSILWHSGQLESYTLLVYQLYDLSGHFRKRIHRQWQWNKHFESCQLSRNLNIFCTFPTIIATNKPFQTH